MSTFWSFCLIEWINIFKVNNGNCYKIMFGYKFFQSETQTNVLWCYRTQEVFCYGLFPYCNYPFRNYHLQYLDWDIKEEYSQLFENVIKYISLFQLKSESTSSERNCTQRKIWGSSWVLLSQIIKIICINASIFTFCSFDF